MLKPLVAIFRFICRSLRGFFYIFDGIVQMPDEAVPGFVALLVARHGGGGKSIENFSHLQVEPIKLRVDAAEKSKDFFIVVHVTSGEAVD